MEEKHQQISIKALVEISSSKHGSNKEEEAIKEIIEKRKEFQKEFDNLKEELAEEKQKE